MDGFFERLGGAVAKHKWAVIGLWVVVFGLAIPGVVNVANALRSGGFEVADSDAGRGAAILEQEFGRRTVTTGVLVFTSDSLTIDDPQYRQAVVDSIARVKQVHTEDGADGVRGVVSAFDDAGNPTGSPQFISQDRRATYAIVNFLPDEEQAKKLTTKVRDQLAAQPEGVRAYLMGFPALSYDLAKGSKEDLIKAEITTIPLTLLLLLVVFRTVLAAGLPLLLGVGAVAISLAGIYLYAQRVETSIFAMNTASMIGLGLGIDFSLLMVSRFREELARGLDAEQATVATVATSGRSIVFSGLTVMLGLSVLCLYDLVLIRSIALAMLLVAGVAMLGAVTLLPALMALFGHRLNNFRVPPPALLALFGRRPESGGRRAGAAGRRPNDLRAQQRDEEGAWHRWSLVVMRRPWLFLAATVAVLLALAWPAREFNAIGSGGARGMPETFETRQAFEALRAGFGPGEATPITVVVRTPRENGAWNPATLQDVYRLHKAIEVDPRVQRVASLVSLTPPTTTEDQFKALPPAQLLGNPQTARFVPSFVNVTVPNGPPSRADTHAITVYSTADELHDDTVNLVKDLRSEIIPSIPELRGSEVYVTGQTAIILDYRDKLFGQFPLMVGLVLLVTYVVLLLFFHSLILPLKAILMNVVAILASYGVLVLVFQHGVGDELLGFEALGRLSMFAPVILFSVLFGLSTDYEVFLLSRVKELYAQTGDNERSVAMGLERTAGIITAAGLIMIVVFGSFALGSTLVIKELGVGLAVAVLLDSTIIRVMMVPASMKLMGDLNWWMPKWLDWIPEIKESAEGPSHAGAPAAHPRALCPSCGAPARPTARFCGRCGTPLVTTPAVPPRGREMPDAGMRGAPDPPPIPVILAPSRGVHDAAGGAEETIVFRDRGRSRVDGGPRRMQVMLATGTREQRTWLDLPDCQVEHVPAGLGLPLIQIVGIDLAPLPGAQPEIQIRHARVRLVDYVPQERRAWLLLRNCQVEYATYRGAQLLLQVSGLDLAPLNGSDPEIRISRARVRV